MRFDVLRPQRLAAPVKVYVRQFSAHPLEVDAAELYADPDGYLNADGVFDTRRQSLDDVPVYEIELLPEDGRYGLPYMARQASGDAWEDDGAAPFASAEQCRQPFYPDASRIFEEIDRFGVSDAGVGDTLAVRADFDFYRAAPAGGYKKGLAADRRTDTGEGDIPPERLGVDFFPISPDVAPAPNAAGSIGAGHQHGPEGARRRQLRRSHLDRGLAERRGVGVLVEPAHRHACTHQLQRGAASARRSQQRRRSQSGRLRGIHRVGCVGGR